MLEKVKIHLGAQSKGDRIHSLPSKFRHPEAVFPIQEHFWAIYFLRLWSRLPIFTLLSPLGFQGGAFGISRL